MSARSLNKLPISPSARSPRVLFSTQAGLRHSHVGSPSKLPGHMDCVSLRCEIFPFGLLVKWNGIIFRPKSLISWRPAVSETKWLWRLAWKMPVALVNYEIMFPGNRSTYELRMLQGATRGGRPVRNRHENRIDSSTLCARDQRPGGPFSPTFSCLPFLMPSCAHMFLSSTTFLRRFVLGILRIWMLVLSEIWLRSETLSRMWMVCFYQGEKLDWILHGFFFHVITLPVSCWCLSAKKNDTPRNTVQLFSNFNLLCNTLCGDAYKAGFVMWWHTSLWSCL